MKLTLNREFNNFFDGKVRGMHQGKASNHLVLCGGVFDNGSIKILDVSNFHFIAENDTAHNQQIYSLAVSPDGKHIATGDIGGNVKIWKYDNLSLARELEQSKNFEF